MITSESYKKKTEGNDGVTYPYDFKIWHKSQIRVVISNKVAPLEKEELTVDTDFQVTGVGLAAGGEIELLGAYAASPPDSTKYVTCIRNIPYKQEVNVDNQAFPQGNVHEQAWDKLTAEVLQLKEKTDRCFAVDETSDEDPEDMELESVVGAPVDDSGFGGVLTGVSPATIQGCLDQIDSDAAPLANPTLTGTPAAPTAAEQTGGTQVATCGYADRAGRVLLGEDTGSALEIKLTPAGISMFTNYDMLDLEIFNAVPGSPTPGKIVYFQFYDNTLGTETWHAVADQVAMGIGVDEDGGSISWGAPQQTMMQLTTAMGNSSSYDGLTGVLKIHKGQYSGDHDPGYEGQITWGYWLSGVDTNRSFANVCGRIVGAGSIDWGGCRLYTSGGFLEGRIRLWGLPKGS